MCLGVMPGPGVGSTSATSTSAGGAGGLLAQLRALGQAVVAGDVRRFEEVSYGVMA
jgi:hypothetical protein